MSRQPRRERPGLDAWFAESIRATFFPAPGAAMAAEEWWRSTVGAEPDTRTVRPNSGERTEQAQFRSGQLVLTVNAAGIIQWTLAAAVPDSIPEGLPNIGAYADESEHFRVLVQRWLESGPQLSRLAFGAVAILPAANRVESYEILDAYLPSVEVDPQGSTDLMYRINRPRPSRTGLPGLSVNRLSTWLSIHLRLGISGMGQSQLQDLAGTNASRVELDINTAPTFEGRFGPNAVPSAEVFDELVALAAEILADGDQP